MLGTPFVRASDDADTTKIQHALDFGAFGAAGDGARYIWLGLFQRPADGLTIAERLWFGGVGAATVIGLLIVLVGMITSYYCSMGKKPKQHRGAVKTGEG